MVDARYEASCEATVRDTFPTVAAWHSSPRFVASAGSELAADDQDWPLMPFTDSLKLEVDLAAEQLHQVQVMLSVDQLSLTSQRVLVRTALIAGSIALWLVAPEDAADRRSRHRLLVEQNHFRHKQALEAQIALERLSGSVQPNLKAMLSHVTAELSKIKQLRAADGQGTTWNDTEIIPSAALYTFRNQQDPKALSNEATFEFRKASAAAHALPWALFNSPGMQASSPVDAHGRAVMTATPLWSDLVNGYMAAYWISTAGWELLAMRGR